MAQAKILIVEDEKLTAESMRRILHLLDYEVVGTAASGEQALALVTNTRPDLTLMDILLAGKLDGIETAARLRETFHTPVVYLTAHTDEAVLARARETRPYGYIIKPVRHLELQVTVEMALARREVDIELQQQRYILNERVKEMNCLLGLGKLIETPNITLEDIFQGTIDLIPPAWQYPDVTCVRLTIDHTSFATDNCAPTPWQQTATITVRNKPIGHIEVGYLEERPPADEGPFMQEERDLIQAIAERLGHVIERLQAQEALHKAYEELEARVHARTAELAAANYQLTHEIAERRRAEKALQEREAKVRAILNATTATVALLDPQGIVLDGNVAFAERFGRPLGHLIGQCVWNLFPPDVAEARKALTHQVFETGRPIRQEDEREGMWNDYVIYPIHDAQGQVVTVAVYAQDITRRVLMQQALRKSEARYRGLFENSAISLWEEDFSEVIAYIDQLRAGGITDFKTYFNEHPEAIAYCAQLAKVTNVNQATLDLYEAKDLSALQNGLDKIFIPESYPIFQEELIALIEGKRYLEVESINCTLTGKKIHIFLRWSVIPGYEQDLSKILISIVDISRRVEMEKALREREAIYSRTFDVIPDAAILWERHSDGRVTLAQANALALEMSQGKIREFLGQSVEKFFAHAPEVATRIWHTFETGEQQRVETQYTFKTVEDQRWLIADYVKTSERFLLNIIRDITERKLAEQAVQESEKWLRQIINLVPHLIFAKDKAGRFLLVNEAGAKFGGLREAQMIGHLESEWVTDTEMLQKIQADDQDVIEQGMTKFFPEERIVDADNQEHIMQTTKIPFEYNAAIGVLGISVDITALKAAERALRDALGEKEVLLRELQHRVKNNLQVITDLIVLQSEQIRDPAPLAHFRELRDRVMAMALVHEELYRLQSLAHIHADTYLSDLVDNLRRSFARRPILVHSEAQEVFLSVDTAIPCGLIVTELVTNALKYAFPDMNKTENCEVRVKLSVEEEHYILSVRDNGIGLPATVNWQAPASLGLELVQSWVEQLQGTLTVDVSSGTTFTITFTVPKE